jgi:hypothetical protein
MSYANELHAKVMQGHMFTRRINGTSYSLWLQADEFVMTANAPWLDSKPRANQVHQLCVNETSPERLAAHWDGFCRQEEETA